MPPILGRVNPTPGIQTGRTATGNAPAGSRPAMSNPEEVAAWYTQQRLSNPNFDPSTVPAGYEWKGDRYERDTHGFLDDAGKWIGMGAAYGAPIVAGGMGLAGLGGAAGAGGAASAGAGGASIAGGVIPNIPYALPSTFGPIAGLGGASAAGAGGTGVLGGILGGIKKGADILGRVSPVLGEMAGSMGDSRVNANNSRLATDRTRLDRANSMDRSIIDRAGVDLDQRKFQLDAPGKRLSTGVRGSLAANYQPTTVSSGAPMTMSSGAQVKPTMFSAPKLGQGAKDLGSLVEQQMLQDQQAGDKFAPLEKVNFPEVRDPEEAGFLESAVNLGAGVAGVGGALANPTMDRLMRRYRSGGSQ